MQAKDAARIKHKTDKYGVTSLIMGRVSHQFWGGIMLNLRFVTVMLLTGMLVMGTGMVSGQTYPNKPIRIVASGAGGTSDFVARLIAQGISGPLGQPVIVDNRGSGIIPGEIVSKAAPDGYNLLCTAGNFWITPLLQKIPYDPVKDFSPITLATIAPALLVVHPSLPAKSVKELIALAKAKPGTLNYGSLPGASQAVLSSELFKSLAAVDLVGVPYRASAEPINALISNEVQLYFVALLGVAPHVKSGRLRALAVTSAQPSALAPGLPTVAASLPGYESVGLSAIFVPAKTPATIINRLNQEIVRYFKQADVKERAFNTGTELVGSSPEQLAATMSAETIRWGKVIKEAGIKGE